MALQPRELSASTIQDIKVCTLHTTQYTQCLYTWKCKITLLFHAYLIKSTSFFCTFYWFLCAEVRVDWQMFRVPREDKSGQLVDLITTIGTPFPRHTPSSPPHHHHVTPSHPHLHHKKPPAMPGLTPEPEPGRDGTETGLSGDGTESGEGSERVEPRQRSEDGSQSSQGLDGPVVRVFLRGHEGVPADRPFSIHPTQMVGD